MSYKDVKTLKFGVHLIFDAYGCPYKCLIDEKLCKKVLNDLVKLAGMHKLHKEPFIISADSNEALGGKDPGGFSCFVLIQESHISLHTFAKRGFFTLDVYSCKPFEFEKIVKYLNKTFSPKDVDILRFDRGLKYPADNIYK